MNHAGHFQTARVGNARSRLPRPRSAYTLIELALAMAVSAILLMALGSAMVLASRAVPAGDSPATALVEAGQVLEALSTELEHALHVSELSEHAITFTLADRDADGSPERVRYAWEGTAGAPLTRQYNDRPAAVVLEGLRSFAFHGEETLVGESLPGVPIETSEQAVAYHINDSLLNLGTSNYTIESNRWLAQAVHPALPEGTLRWRATSGVAYVARAGSTFEYTRFQVRPRRLDARPASSIFTEAVLYEILLPPPTLLLPTWTWGRFQFAAADAPLMPGQMLSLVVAHPGSGGASAFIRYTNGGPGGLASTSDGGNTWNLSNNTLHYVLYGRATVPGPTRTLQRRHLTSVGVRLQTDAAPHTTLDTRAALANRPERLEGWWMLDFARDPTTLDVNADGQADWRIYDGSTFAAASLSGGVWRPAGQMLHTQPSLGFTGVTTVRARMRHTAADGGYAMAMIDLDHTGGAKTSLLALTQMQADGTQAVAIATLTSAGSWRTLTLSTGWPAEFIDLRLVADPDRKAVHIRINGSDLGTHLCDRTPTSAARGAALLGSVGSAAEFDYVAIRAGGGDG